MLVSPTEPRELRELGTVSTLPEKHGADFMFASMVGTVGVQRKEVNDLIASLHDGRLGKELGQLNSLDLGVLIIEGSPHWSRDGFLLSARSFTKTQFLGVLFSVQAQGLWCMNSANLLESGQLLISLEKWLSKDRHGLIRNRPKAKGEWGTANNREWGIHLLQSFNGIGPEVAARIYDSFDGVPLAWTVTKIDLQAVKGVGKVRAEKMISALGGTEDVVESSEMGGR